MAHPETANATIEQSDTCSLLALKGPNHDVCPTRDAPPLADVPGSKPWRAASSKATGGCVIGKFINPVLPKWHRRAGLVFAVAMIANGLSAAGISAYEGKSIFSGLATVYMVYTAFTAVRPLPAVGRGIDIGLMLLACGFAAATYLGAFTALGRPGNQLDGVPAGMLFFLATVFLLALIGDARMIWAGGIQGTRRLARHLWRMWRVRLRQNLRGLMTTKPIAAPSS